MKEFDLEKAKAGHPICTRDGREVRILCFDRQSYSPIVALVKSNEVEDVVSFNEKGRRNDVFDSRYDLLIKTVRQERWTNIYKDLNGILFLGGSLYSSQKEAEMEAEEGAKAYSYYKTVRVEWEE